MLSQLFVGVVAFFALFSSAAGQACNPGQPYGPLADGSCDPYVPPVNVANPAAADHTTGVQMSDYQLSSLNSLTNFVFLVLSEDSFDNLMATFPGVNNLQTLIASNSVPQQINWTTGQPYASFPADPTNGIPAGLPNKPFDIVAQSGIPGVSLSSIFSNPSHNYHQTQLKINGGAENGWIYWSTGKSATMGMGYYNLAANPNTGIWGIGQNFTVFDRFHVGSFGDQVCAHMYTIGAATPAYDSANPGKCPASILSQTQWFAPTAYNGSMWLLSDPTTQPALSRDCYLIGDVVSAQICNVGGDLVFPQIPNSQSNPGHFGDLADAAGVSWAYYSENFTLSENSNCSIKDGWNRHESALTHFTTFNTVNSSYWLQHEKDASQFWAALSSTSLEQVSWYRPSQNEDYGFSNNDPSAGATFIDNFFQKIYASSLWQQNKLAVLVTFSDANGMFVSQHSTHSRTLPAAVLSSCFSSCSWGDLLFCVACTGSRPTLRRRPLRPRCPCACLHGIALPLPLTGRQQQRQQSAVRALFVVQDAGSTLQHSNGLAAEPVGQRSLPGCTRSHHVLPARCPGPAADLQRRRQWQCGCGSCVACGGGCGGRGGAGVWCVDGAVRRVEGGGIVIADSMHGRLVGSG